MSKRESKVRAEVMAAAVGSERWDRAMGQLAEILRERGEVEAAENLEGMVGQWTPVQ